MKTTKIKLAGLTCTACTKITAKRIKQIAGITNVTVTLEDSIAEIVADREITSNEVAEAISETGYSVA